MPKVFISYRRDDAAWQAHTIYERLASRLGPESVFFDVDAIPLGVNFRSYLHDQVHQCVLLLAVIGEGWLDAQDDGGQRRLDNPDDFVRIEIEAALARNIPVVPVLVNRAMMPKADRLPPTLRALVHWQAAEVRPGRDLAHHLERLVSGVERALQEAARPAAPPPSIVNSSL